MTTTLRADGASPSPASKPSDALKEWDGRSVGESAPFAAYCDIALQDAQIQVLDRGEKIWSYDDTLFTASLARNGYKIICIEPKAEGASEGPPSDAVASTSNDPAKAELVEALRDEVLEEAAKAVEAVKADRSDDGWDDEHFDAAIEAVRALSKASFTPTTSR